MNFGGEEEIKTLIDEVGDMILEEGADQAKISNMINLGVLTALASIAVILEEKK